MDDPFLLRRSSAAELLLIRHADAIPEADEIIPSGVYDNLPLSRTGRTQVKALTERLWETHVDAIYSSPLLRCRHTAAPLAEHLGLPPIIVENLKEVHFDNLSPLPEVKAGDNLEVLTRALQEQQADIIRLAAQVGNWDNVPHSEPSASFRKRVVEAIDGIAHHYIGQRVLIFAHGGSINAYAAQALGLQRDFFFPCANTSITMIRVNADLHRVVYALNDIAHLKLI